MKKIFFDPPHPCPYLLDKLATTIYEVNLYLTPDEYSKRLNTGWRKFGITLFKPICKDCKECRPLRVLVKSFKFSNNFRKIVKKNSYLDVIIDKPISDYDHINLYNKYHLAKNLSKKWPLTIIDSPDEYEFYFLNNRFTTIEICLKYKDKILGVMILDDINNALSAVYHYYDPEYTKNSLGTFLILESIFLAQKLNKDYLHLGYFVLGSKDMMYKCRFKPAEILDEFNIWQAFETWVIKRNVNTIIPFISLPCPD